MILSIDIGLRNLALCCMSADIPTDFQTYQIHLWNVYNVLDSDDYHCESLQKNGNICGKKCSQTFINENSENCYTCKLHFPKNIENTKNNIFKKKSVNDYLLQDIAKIFIKKIQDIYDDENEIFKNITSIVIELQPTLNPKMKFISHILYGKLVELYKDTTVDIKFVAAASKLKIFYDGPELICNLKGVYAQRKWLSIQYTKWYLENKFSEEQKNKWLPFLLESKNKTDDMTDTYLMSINALHGIPKKEKVKKERKSKKSKIPVEIINTETDIIKL
jgi:hypothetical protein